MARTKQTSRQTQQSQYKKATFQKRKKKQASQSRSGASGSGGRRPFGQARSAPWSSSSWLRHMYDSDSGSDSNSFFGYYDDNFYGYDFSDEELSDDDVTGMGHDDLDDEVYYGKLNGTIVGLQYYRGTVNSNEHVALEREPENKFDINAIKVKNVANKQVGHIKRDLAKPLAFIVDKGLARMEGIVPSGMKNLYSMQVDLLLWGKQENYKATADKLKLHGFYLMGGSGAGAGKQGSGSGAAAAATAMAEPVRTFLSPSEVKNELDKLFEDIKEGDKTTCIDPVQAIATPMYPHQRQALNWLMSRENSTALPPFWQERNKHYFNSVLNFTTSIRPDSVKGGILADDMGLGKTLEMIALIVTNFVDGQPLAAPVTGLVRRSRQELAKAVKTQTTCEDSAYVPRRSKIRLIIDRPDSKSCHTLGEIHPLLGGAAGDAGMLPRQPEDDTATGQTPLAEKFNKVLSKGDPDFSPEDKLAKVPIASDHCRPKRSSRKPGRYVYSSEEDELINDETPRKKIKLIPLGSKASAKSRPLVKGACESLEERYDCGVGQDSSVEQRKTDEAAADTDNQCATSESQPSAKQTDPALDLPDLDKLSRDTCSSTGTGDDLPDLEVTDSDKSVGENLSEMKASLFKSLGQELEKMSDTGEPYWTVIGESPAVNITRKAQKQIEVCNKPGLEFLDMLSDRGFTVAQLKKMLQGADMSKAIELIGQHVQQGPCAGASQTKASVNTSATAVKQTKVKIEQFDPGYSCETKPATCSSFGGQMAMGQSMDDDCSSDTVVVTDYNKPSILEIAPSTGRTNTAGPRCTLIVCPLSVLSNWLNQFEEHVHRRVHLAIYLYYGQQRIKNTAVLEKHDVVITTYSTIAADFKKSEKNAFNKVQWLRIVLDEGHTIRNPNALQTKAINQLKAHRKWVLTGTPIQNEMRDLWSLINFLQVNPFTDRHWWRRTIEGPVTRGDKTAITKLQYLMGHLCLRRTKTQKVDGKALVALPARNVFIEHVELSQEERATYEAMQKDGRLIVSKYVRQGTLLHNYSQVLAILMRLRQICCHPFLVAKAAKAVKDTLAALDDNNGDVGNEELRQKLIDTLLMVLSSGTDEECAICLDSLKAPVITPCAHVYCRTCIENVIKNELPQSRCPLCRADLQQDKLLEVPPEKLQGEREKGDDDLMLVENWKSSAKVDAMMNALLKLRSDDPSIKSLVVSQFTSLLDLIEIPLRTNGFSFVRLDGTMTTRARVEAIRRISDLSPGSPTIMLLSLKAGGVGINLTAASRVFLMDPAWNPAVEEQCFDRCHRLGQTRDVIVTKFIVDDSVENRMLDLQERKRRLMQGAFGKKQSAEQKRQERIRDIKSLLDI